MTKQANSQLDKILAMADSSHDSEALVAVRMARQLLSRDGLSFSDLARAAQKPRVNLPFGFFSGQHIINLEAEILQIRQELEDLRTQKVVYEADAKAWQQKAAEFEQKLIQSQSDATRWRQLAKETVDKLWDLGQSIEKDEMSVERLSPVKSA